MNKTTGNANVTGTGTNVDDVETLALIRRQLEAGAPIPSWLAQPCPAWCAYTDTHVESDMPQDRVHSSRQMDILLTLHKPVDMTDGKSTWWQPDTARVWLERHYREAEPTILIARGDTDEPIKFTLGEAQQLLAALSEEISTAVAALGGSR